MKTIDILNFFKSQAFWIDPVHSVDKIIVGDPDKDVKRVLVSWLSSFNAIERAAGGGFDMLITHEPTFWVHADELDTIEKWDEGLKRETAFKKKALIENSGLVVVRNHDVWDLMPKVGIPWAWAAFLGFGSKPAAMNQRTCHHRYDIEPITVDGLAAQIAEKTAVIGEPAIQVFGNGKAVVSKVGVGTGCGCEIEVFRSLGCDISIVCDDGSIYWRDIQWAEETNHPVIRVNHATSEEPGMITLAKYINDNIPGVYAEHLPYRTMMKVVTGTGPIP
jgi:putative NIF3 family GTP cyclohydrolase 1 type 2